MTTTRLLSTVAALLALYGGSGAFMTNTGREWTLFLFSFGAIALALSGPLSRAIVSAFTFSLAALCAMIAWRALGRGTPEWFLTHYGMMSLFWLGLSALLAAPLFENPAAAPATESAVEPDVELEAEPA